MYYHPLQPDKDCIVPLLLKVTVSEVARVTVALFIEPGILVLSFFHVIPSVDVSTTSESLPEASKYPPVSTVPQSN